MAVKFSGNRLQSLRNEKGLTQKQLAEKLGVSLSTIIKYEGNERQPEPAALERMLNIFDVSLDYLFARSGEKHAEKKLFEQSSLDLIEYMEMATDSDIKKLMDKSPFMSLQNALKTMDCDSRKEAVEVLNSFLKLLSSQAAQSHEGKFHKESFTILLQAVKEVSRLNSLYLSTDEINEDELSVLQLVKSQTEVKSNLNSLLDDLLELRLQKSE